MNFVFDINAAGQLISEMDTYSQNVQKSAVEILDIGKAITERKT